MSEQRLITLEELIDLIHKCAYRGEVIKEFEKLPKPESIQIKPQNKKDIDK